MALYGFIETANGEFIRFDEWTPERGWLSAYPATDADRAVMTEIIATSTAA